MLLIGMSCFSIIMGLLIMVYLTNHRRMPSNLTLKDLFIFRSQERTLFEYFPTFYENPTFRSFINDLILILEQVKIQEDCRVETKNILGNIIELLKSLLSEIDHIINY